VITCLRLEDNGLRSL
jgi:hypothetical protein